MIHFSSTDRIGGTIASIYVTLKLTVFSEFVHHVWLVLWDAGLAGVAGLLAVHYGKKILPVFDKWVAKQFNRIFKK